MAGHFYAKLELSCHDICAAVKSVAALVSSSSFLLPPLPPPPPHTPPPDWSPHHHPHPKEPPPPTSSLHCCWPSTPFTPPPPPHAHTYHHHPLSLSQTALSHTSTPAHNPPRHRHCKKGSQQMVRCTLPLEYSMQCAKKNDSDQATCPVERLQHSLYCCKEERERGVGVKPN